MNFDLPHPAGFSTHRKSLAFSRSSLHTEVGRIIAASGLGAYEPETLAAAAAIVEVECIDSVADIGANIGIHSLVLKSLFGPAVAVEAFEPLPLLHDLASQLAEENGLDVSIYASAVSNIQGMATLYVSSRSDSSNSLNPTFREAKSTISVPTTTLDDEYVARRAPGLIKIDTESTEPDVLAGGARFFQSNRPWIIVEVLRGRTEEKLEQFCNSQSYIPIRLGTDTLSPTRPIRGDAKYIHRDWLFAPRPPSLELELRYKEWLAAFSSSRVAR